MEADPRDALAMTLASFGRAIEEREAEAITGVHELPRNTAPNSNQIVGNRFADPSPSTKAPNPITEAEIEVEKQRQIARLLGTDPPS